MKVSRYEINREVRKVLVRHGVDSSKMSFSCTQRAAYFRGKLAKEQQGDFDIPQIESMCKDLERLPFNLRLVFDMDNWSIAFDAGAWNISQVKKGGGGGGTRTEETYVIEKPESLDTVVREVLDEK